MATNRMGVSDVVKQRSDASTSTDDNAVLLRELAEAQLRLDRLILEMVNSCDSPSSSSSRSQGNKVAFIREPNYRPRSIIYATPVKDRPFRHHPTLVNSKSQTGSRTASPLTLNFDVVDSKQQHGVAGQSNDAQSRRTTYQNHKKIISSNSINKSCDHCIRECEKWMMRETGSLATLNTSTPLSRNHENDFTPAANYGHIATNSWSNTLNRKTGCSDETVGHHSNNNNNNNSNSSKNRDAEQNHRDTSSATVRNADHYENSVRNTDHNSELADLPSPFDNATCISDADAALSTQLHQLYTNVGIASHAPVCIETCCRSIQSCSGSQAQLQHVRPPLAHVCAPAATSGQMSQIVRDLSLPFLSDEHELLQCTINRGGTCDTSDAHHPFPLQPHPRPYADPAGRVCCCCFHSPHPHPHDSPARLHLSQITPGLRQPGDNIACYCCCSCTTTVPLQAAAISDGSSGQLGRQEATGPRPVSTRLGDAGYSSIEPPVTASSSFVPASSSASARGGKAASAPATKRSVRIAVGTITSDCKDMSDNSVTLLTRLSQTPPPLLSSTSHGLTSLAHCQQKMLAANTEGETTATLQTSTTGTMNGFSLLRASHSSGGGGGGGGGGGLGGSCSLPRSASVGQSSSFSHHRQQQQQRRQPQQLSGSSNGIKGSVSYFTLGSRERDRETGQPRSALGGRGGSAYSLLATSDPDGDDWLQRTPKFVHDTSKFWYKPFISRDDIIRNLRDKPVGSFIIRDSNTYPGAYGMAVKVDRIPDNVPVKGDLQAELVRHYLIEPTSTGVRLKGYNTEPSFGSLAALVYQHSITPLALPCTLLLPCRDLTETADIRRSTATLSAMPPLVTNAAVCSVVFMASVELESLTGPEAVQKAVTETLQQAAGQQMKTTVVQLEVSPGGITVTDVKRKLFFRRHYPVNTVSYAGLDPENRRWSFKTENGLVSAAARLFGFVAKKHINATENLGHVFAELSADQPALAVVNFIQKQMMEQGRLAKS